MPLRTGVAVTVIGLVLGACGLLPPVGGDTFQDGSESIPGPGYYTGVAEPVSVAEAITVESFGEDGTKIPAEHLFAAGQAIEFDGIGLPSQRGLAVNGTPCEGRIPITTDMVTEVVLHLGPGTCEVTVTRIRLADGT